MRLGVTLMPVTSAVRALGANWSRLGAKDSQASDALTAVGASCSTQGAKLTNVLSTVKPWTAVWDVLNGVFKWPAIWERAAWGWAGGQARGLQGPEVRHPSRHAPPCSRTCDASPVTAAGRSATSASNTGSRTCQRGAGGSPDPARARWALASSMTRPRAWVAAASLPSFLSRTCRGLSGRRGGRAWGRRAWRADRDVGGQPRPAAPCPAAVPARPDSTNCLSQDIGPVAVV